MDASPDITRWVLAWLAIAVFLLIRHWRTGTGVGLLLGYVIGFGAIHWLATALDMLPWFDHDYPDTVAEGMRLSTIGLLTFAGGVELAGWMMDRRRAALEGIDQADGGDESDHAHLDPRVVTLYLVAGLLIQLVLFPLARGIATVTALLATGSTLVVAGVSLKCWNAWQRGDGWTLVAWLIASMILPFFTVATQGFLGYGLAAMMAIYAFVAAFYGPRVKVLLAAAVLAYLGLSVYVTYMRDRAEIRSVVWSGSSLADRAERLNQTISEMEWFDPGEPDHLVRVEHRLNQNFLVGAAVQYIGAGHAPFARGATLYEALLSLLPRAIWPDKPVSAGSSDLVSRFTGIRFAADTSVGVGQVLEWYVNFGTFGVTTGFFLFGLLVAWLDRSAFDALAQGDIARFAARFVPGLALINMGGSFVEMTASAGAGLAMVAMLNFSMDHLTAGGSRGVLRTEVRP
jgi:hypothetical protein